TRTYPAGAPPAAPTAYRTPRRPEPARSSDGSALVWVSVGLMSFLFVGLALLIAGWWVFRVINQERDVVASNVTIKFVQQPVVTPPPKPQERPDNAPGDDEPDDEDKGAKETPREPKFADGTPWIGLGDGCQAPDIDGEDLDGKAFRLSD